MDISVTLKKSHTLYEKNNCEQYYVVNWQWYHNELYIFDKHFVDNMNFLKTREIDMSKNSQDIVWNVKETDELGNIETSYLIEKKHNDNWEMVCCLHMSVFVFDVSNTDRWTDM